MQLAHRGISDYYPENTLSAFQAVLGTEYDGIETDIQLTKDNILVLCHDYKINRTSNGKGYIKDMTYKELLEYNFNNHFDIQEKIPTLQELLELFKDTNYILNLECKEKVREGMIEKVAQMVKDYHMEKQVIFSSTSLDQMLEMKSYLPNNYCALISDHFYKKTLQDVLEHRLDGIHSRYTAINDKQKQFLRNNNITIGVWTITNQKQFDYYKDVDILFTNHYFKETK